VIVHSVWFEPFCYHFLSSLPKKMSPKAVFYGESTANLISVSAPPQTPTGELTTLPQTPSRLGRGTPSQTPPLNAYGAALACWSYPTCFPTSQALVALKYEMA